MKEIILIDETNGESMKGRLLKELAERTQTPIFSSVKEALKYMRKIERRRNKEEWKK